VPSSLQAPVDAPEPSSRTPVPSIQPVELGDPVRTDDPFQLQPAPPRRLDVEPLTATESRLHITVSRPFLNVRVDVSRSRDDDLSPGALKGADALRRWRHDP